MTGRVVGQELVLAPEGGERVAHRPDRGDVAQLVRVDHGGDADRAIGESSAHTARAGRRDPGQRTGTAVDRHPMLIEPPKRSPMRAQAMSVRATWARPTIEWPIAGCLSAAVAAEDHVLGQDGLQRREVAVLHGREEARRQPLGWGARPRTAGAPPAPGAARGRRAGGRSPASGRGYRRSRRSRSRRRRAGGSTARCSGDRRSSTARNATERTRPSPRAGPDRPRSASTSGSGSQSPTYCSRRTRADRRDRSPAGWRGRHVRRRDVDLLPGLGTDGAEEGLLDDVLRLDHAPSIRYAIAKARRRSASRSAAVSFTRVPTPVAPRRVARRPAEHALGASFVAPRVSVEIVTIASPATRRASQRGIRRGGARRVRRRGRGHSRSAPARRRRSGRAARAAFDRRDRRIGRIGDVDE